MPTNALEDPECAQLRCRIKRLGLDQVSKDLQLNTTTLLRAACGMPLHTATRLVIQQALKGYNGEA
jgi:hypothetical protein